MIGRDSTRDCKHNRGEVILLASSEGTVQNAVYETASTTGSRPTSHGSLTVHTTHTAGTRPTSCGPRQGIQSTVQLLGRGYPLVVHSRKYNTQYNCGDEANLLKSTQQCNTTYKSYWRDEVILLKSTTAAKGTVTWAKLTYQPIKTYQELSNSRWMAQWT